MKRLVTGQVSSQLTNQILYEKLFFVSISHFRFVITRDPNSLVETISFANIGKLQPFLISLNTTALVVMDVHCFLTRSEVVGYLAGQWDINTNSNYTPTDNFLITVLH